MIHFLTFGDGNIAFRSAAKRLSKQAELSNWFDTVTNYDLIAIRKSEPAFFSQIENLVSTYSTSLGFMVWKPLIILAKLKQLNEGEVLIYLDAGCQLNVNEISKSRLDFYVDLTIQHGILAMQLRPGSFNFQDLSEEAWTHPETLKHMTVSRKEAKVNQVQAGIIFLKKSAETVEFVDNWWRICTSQDFTILSPHKRTSSNLNHNHRFEQSIFSILVKRSNSALIPDETYFHPEWTTGKDFPIWAMRNRSGGDAFRRNFSDLVIIATHKLVRIISTFKKAF